MPGWAAFVGLTGLLLTALLALARLSQGLTDESGLSATAEGVPSLEEHADTPTPDPVIPRFETPESARRRRWVESRRSNRPESISTGALLANVALTQGLFGALLVAAAFYYRIPVSAFGVSAAPLSTGWPALAVGVAAGVGFWLGNEAAASLAAGFDMAFDESVRGLLAPDSAGGWVVLLGVILPIIAVVEELLFRGAAIGVPVAGLGAPAWAMAIVSSVAFALGHGAQGRVGILVTGALGLGLAGLFVVTDSLLAVVVAHYLVNALELGVHEGLGIERLSL
ncbi:CPBP family intramembrane glutamic endopeptidase [Haloarcula halophila]|uniref:CPBP family intramembrane glutamic endopeptidase n=1 Tax=Haloarcula TaxID=2237 RepID=UPI0023E41C47|nr:CPBP family intramembrane glutamic endopeptidase [Halomicroarcula sp. DFY41]